MIKTIAFWPRLLPVLLALATVPAMAVDVPAQAEPQAGTVAPALMKPGDYLWYPQIAPSGPVLVVISLDEQRVYVYRNGIAIGVSTISSGKPGKDTPPGVFTILQKNKDHRSNLYNNAPMPYMQRLTWDGIALHGGTLPGHPASHGCVRLPQAFAQKLFAITRTGDTVVVANAHASSPSVVHPALLAPINSKGLPLPVNESEPDYFWDDSLAPIGPVSVLVSVGDRRVFVMRNGVVIGESGLTLADDFAVHGSVLMVMGEQATDAPSLLDPDRKRYQWTAYPLLSTQTARLPAQQKQWPEGALQVSPEFSRKLYAALAPGATVLLTDLPAVRATVTEPELQPVLESDQATPIANDKP
ncbi:MAG: L,D-transpeptidase [Pseudoxanthomonas sp.]